MSWKKLALKDEQLGDDTLNGGTSVKRPRKASWKTLSLDDERATVELNKPRSTNDWKQLALDDDECDAVTVTNPPMQDGEMSCTIAPISIDINLATLKLLPKDTGPGSLTAQSMHGKDRKRITTILKGSCGCSGNKCFSQFTVNELTTLVGHWYDCSKESRQQVLWTLYNPGPELEADSTMVNAAASEPPKRRTWAVNGKQLCFTGFCKALGHSKKTVQSYCHGDPEVKKELSKVNMAQRIHPQRDLCNHFFLELYLTCAEDLPEFEHSAKNVDDMIEKGTSEEVTLKFDKSFVYSTEIPIAERVNMLVGGSDVKCHMRFLPPSKPMDLWYQFLAWCESQNRLQRTKGLRKGSNDEYIPSWATFYRTWDEIWYKKLLDFRKRSMHAECSVCFQARADLHSRGLPVQERLIVATKWREHLCRQYADRLLYYSLRYMSRARLGTLCCILDSMDKSKMAWPKYSWQSGRIPKDLDQLGLTRPRMALCLV